VAAQKKVRAVYMRGGTSRCLVFHANDLPAPGRARDAILLAALGSPDPYGRQLDGLGGGISSLSKACIIGPPTLPGADVDYTFAQIEVKKASVDYNGNCGNCSSSVGPFAIDEGLVAAREGETLVRIHNTNTKKLIVAHVPVADGEAAVAGDFELAGVAGRGARIALDFVEPGGAGTGRLLPTGRPRDVIAGVEVSCVDATNAVVFVRARDLGLTGTETPQAIDADHDLSARLEKLRVEAGARMGMPESAAVPKIAFVAPPADYTGLDGGRYGAGDHDVLARAISMGNCHRAFPLTAAMCLAVAARIDGTVVRECSTARDEKDVRLGHPSGVLPLDARVALKDGKPWAERVTVYRTARRLMEGWVRVP
jgi:2-methylaconitate cis-trans-isomerase PrpF